MNSKNEHLSGRKFVSRVLLLILSAVLLVIFIYLISRDNHEQVLNHIFRHSLSNKTIQDTDTVLTINSEPVSWAEFNLVMSGLRVRVYTYFQSKFDFTENENFWETEYSGEIPGKKLIDETINALKRIKIEQILMKEEGIVDDISFTDFIKELKNENARRKKAIANKTSIYGPTEFNEKIYYEFLQMERSEKLKIRMSGSKLHFSEDDIRNYYNNNKDTKFMLPGKTRIERIILKIHDDSVKTGVGAPVINKENDPLETMIHIQEMAFNNKEFTEIVNELQRQGNNDVSFEEHIIDVTTMKMLANTYHGIFESVFRLETHVVSDIITEANTLNIIKVIEREYGTYITLEEARPQINREMTDSLYNSLLSNLAEQAVVKLNGRIISELSFK